jgi:hypothetical protein
MENKMNARIKEIEIQSVFYNEDTQSWEFDRKKFAELIVKECMSVARGMRNPSNLNYKPSDRFVDELRLHFGVEE